MSGLVFVLAVIVAGAIMFYTGMAWATAEAERREARLEAWEMLGDAEWGEDWK